MALEIFIFYWFKSRYNSTNCNNNSYSFKWKLCGNITNIFHYCSCNTRSNQSTGTICNGVPQSYSITSPDVATTYGWSRAEVPGISNPAVSGQTSNPITETLNNTTSSPVDVVYLITPFVNGCTGSQFTYTVTVKPSPTASFTALPGPNSCIGSNVIYTTQSGQSTYSWTVPGVLNTDYSIISGGTDQQAIL